MRMRPVCGRLVVEDLAEGLDGEVSRTAVVV